MHSTILICSASLVILTLLLAFWTSIQRGNSKTVAYNAPLEPTSGMAKAQRAHGNAAEYAADPRHARAVCSRVLASFYKFRALMRTLMRALMPCAPSHATRSHAPPSNSLQR